jgi:aldehyde dehydrogenase (NAD+)
VTAWSPIRQLPGVPTIFIREEYTMPNLSEVDRVFALQKAAIWRRKTSSAADQIEPLVRLRNRLQRAGGEVAEALLKDMGRPKVEMPFDLQNVIDAADEAIEKLADWMAPTPVAPKSKDPDVRSYIHYEARGVVLVLGPWNFPFHLCFEPLIAALAAGNSVIVKPASTSPATSALVAAIVREIFDESVAAVFEGGSKVATALLDKPFDHIFMTGSPKVGKMVMAAAARHLASVTLELGGKNPAIIDRTADLDVAAEALATGRTMNAGQTCLSIDYVLVPTEMSDILTTKMIDLFKGEFYDDGEFKPEKLGRFIDAENYWRVRGYIDEAVSLGGKILFGGSSDAETLTMEPTILTDVSADSMIMEDEIFGPVTVIISYVDLQDALGIIHRHGKPLGFCIFSRDEKFVQEVVQHTTSGGVSVNSWIDHYFDGRLAFGGVNGSGIGHYHSIYGFREFSHQRAVFERGMTAA